MEGPLAWQFLGFRSSPTELEAMEAGRLEKVSLDETPGQRASVGLHGKQQQPPGWVPDAGSA